MKLSPAAIGLLCGAMVGLMVFSPVVGAQAPSAPTDFTEVDLEAAAGVTVTSRPDDAPVRVNPEDPDDWIVAACGTGGGLNIGYFRTQDQGQTWTHTKVATQTSSAESCDLRFHPTDGQRIAMSWDPVEQNPHVVAVSTDGGSSWSTTDTNGGSSDGSIFWYDLDSLAWSTYRTSAYLIRGSNDTGATFDSGRVLGTVSDQQNPFFDCADQLDFNPSYVRYLCPQSDTAWTENDGATWQTDTVSTSHAFEVSLKVVTVDHWYMVVNAGADQHVEVKETLDAGATWSTIHVFNDNEMDSHRGLEVPETDVLAFAGSVQGESGENGLHWFYSDNNGTNFTDVYLKDQADCDGACFVSGHARSAEGNYIVSAYDDSGFYVFFSEDTVTTEAPAPGPSPTDFAGGLQEAIVSLGFRTERSQMFFSVALVGITTVATGTALKFMGPGRVKNWSIVGAAAGAGVFMVLIFLLEFWMFLIAMVVGAAIVKGPTTFVNTLGEIKREAERTVGAEPVRTGETVTSREEPGMVDVGEAEMVETTGLVDVGEETELVDVGDAEDVEV